MQEERSYLLAQVPLTVSPFINLPKAPTLPHNYTSLPGTLPASILSHPANSGTSQSEPLAYVTSPQQTFSAHPSTIAAQNQALLDRLARTPDEARQKVEAWERGIEDRELREKRRRAPGWLDREEKILSPERAGGGAGDDGRAREGDVRAAGVRGDSDGRRVEGAQKDEGELGALMDRAFGSMG